MRRYRLKRTATVHARQPDFSWVIPQRGQWCTLNPDPRNFYAKGLAEFAGRPVYVLRLQSLAHAAQLRENLVNKMIQDGKDVPGAWVYIPEHGRRWVALQDLQGANALQQAFTQMLYSMMRQNLEQGS